MVFTISPFIHLHGSDLAVIDDNDGFGRVLAFGGRVNFSNRPDLRNAARRAPWLQYRVGSSRAVDA